MSDRSELEARLNKSEQRVEVNARRLESVDDKAGEFRRYSNVKLWRAVIGLIFWLAFVLFVAIPFAWYALTHF
jgi:hypothetical protein